MKKRKIIEKNGKYYTVRGIELTHCSNTMTTAEFFSFILGGLRRLTKYWRPKLDKLHEGRRKYTGIDKRTKWEYQCEYCLNWFKQMHIEMDHIIPCGGCNSYDKVVPWLKKAFIEKEGYQILCITCHTKKTNGERNLK